MEQFSIDKCQCSRLCSLLVKWPLSNVLKKTLDYFSNSLIRKIDFCSQSWQHQQQQRAFLQCCGNSNAPMEREEYLNTVMNSKLVTCIHSSKLLNIECKQNVLKLNTQIRTQYIRIITQNYKISMLLMLCRLGVSREFFSKIKVFCYFSRARCSLGAKYSGLHLRYI